MMKINKNSVTFYIKDWDVLLTIPSLMTQLGDKVGMQFPTTVLYLGERFFQNWSFYIAIFGFGIGVSHKSTDDYKAFR
jgi:hypothetical protein